MITSIKEIRKALKMSQKDFAKAIGIAKSSIGNYENNVRAPRPEIAFRIIKYAHSRGLVIKLDDIYSTKRA
jgi:DNA-binding XRE family transcriptional regulator